MNVHPELARGREAYQRRAWREAYEALAGADAAASLTPGDLEQLAVAAHLVARDDEFVATLERAHHGYKDADDPLAAARCAFWIGVELGGRGETGPAGGWLGRADRLVGDRDCVERGYLRLASALQAFGGGDYQATHDAAATAAGIAQRFDDADLHALALQSQGRALVRQTRIEEGLALLDEAMVGVASDELSPRVTGIVYCSVISACRDVWALRRAHEWTEALSDWCAHQPDLVAYRGQCSVHRAEILHFRGDWEQAIEEARRVSERAGEKVEGEASAAALYQQGEVHRMRGELAAAEAAYREASRLGREPQPGLALLRLAQGNERAAVAATRRVLGETRDPTRRARLLPAHIEIMLSAGELDAAEEACEELEAIVADIGTEFLEASAAHARGAVELARGEARSALMALRTACDGWRALEAPYQTARTRELLGRACRELGDEDTAALELDAVRAVYERLGAAPDLARLDRRSAAGSRADHGLTPRELEVLASLATGKTNRKIADELFISEKTVASHVSNIFSKLGLSSRAAATAYAYEHDLLEPPA